MPELIKEFDLHADLAGTDDVGSGPFGHRLNVSVSGGEVLGDRIKGTLVGAGADWLLAGPDGYGRLDVRITLKTVDGAHIYLQYDGLLEMTPAIVAVLGGSDAGTDFGDQYFFCNPRLETGDERYTWVNRTVFIAQGRAVPGPAVEYCVYRIANSSQGRRGRAASS
jgi:hypothetical protein